MAEDVGVVVGLGFGVGGEEGEPSSLVESFVESSLETQRQIVGASESLNGRKNMARRKAKNGEKK